MADEEEKLTLENAQPSQATSEPEEAEEVDANADLEDRKKDYTKLKKIQEQLGEIYTQIVGGFEDKQEQSEDIDEFWDIYNCVLNENQAYFGNSQVYVAAVADSVDALTTRDNNMLFPINGRYASAVGPNGLVPFEVLALLDHYCDLTGMRENIVPSLLRTGKVTGHYLLRPGWKETKQYVVRKKKTALVESELETPVDGAEEVDDVEFEEVVSGTPTLEVLDPRDVCILPATVDSIKDAAITAVRLNLSKPAIQAYIDDGTFDEDAGKQLIDNFGETPTANETDTTKKSLSEAGVRKNSQGNKTATVYLAWAELKLRKGEKRRMQMFFAGGKNYLACKRLPYWNDKIPLLGQPLRKVPGSVWGRSPLKKVAPIQYALNDVVNEGLDSSQYSLMPITASDPAKNPRTGTMVLTMGALWECDPNSTKFMEFPQLWKEAFQMAESLDNRIMKSMGTNPAMIPHGNAAKKPTQAQVSQEQQVALESTGDSISILEKGIFDELLNWFFDLDYQFRTEKIEVRQFGQLGRQAKMSMVDPFESYTAYKFKWYGTEGSKAVQQVQQMIAAMNVIRGIPPDQLNGRKVDIGPIIEHIAEVAFGPRIAPNVLIDQRHQLSMSPMEENIMMANGYPTSVQQLDDDVAHLKVHMEAERTAPGNELMKLHIMAHMNALNMKSQAASGGKPGGAQGVPGGAGAGVPGTPRQGAIAGPPKPMQNPPGAVHQDQMNDPSRVPR